MRVQRVRGGESRIEMQTVKWTAEGMGNGRCQVFHDVKVYVSYRRYAGISQRVWSKKIINQGGTASGKEMTPVLDRIGFSVRGVFLYSDPDSLRYSTNFQTEKGGKSHVSHTGRNEKNNRDNGLPVDPRLQGDLQRCLYSH